MGLVPSLACSYIMVYLQKKNIFAEINFNTHSPTGVIQRHLSKSTMAAQNIRNNVKRTFAIRFATCS